MLNSCDDGLEIILVGFVSNTCVEGAARFGMELGYDATLVRDATAPSNVRVCMNARSQWATLRARSNRERLAQSIAALIQAPQYSCKGESYAAPI
jgi:nicotinamidase-related amidase